MSPVLRITFALGAVCASAVLYYLVRSDAVETDAHTETFHHKPRRGVVERPADPKMLAGSYYQGDGLGFNIVLTLNPSNTYTERWYGCLGTYAEASGSWTLADTRIVFTPSMETGAIHSRLKSLDVLRFQDQWILVSTDKNDRELYDSEGITRLSCFQDTGSILKDP
jgi:hypothetical protein